MRQSPRCFNFFKLIICLIISLFITPLQAAPNDEIGRLFSSQTERKALDLSRQNQKLTVIKLPKIIAPETTINSRFLESFEPITLQGYVKRSDHAENTLWINHRTVPEVSIINHIRVGHLQPHKRSDLSNNSLSLIINVPENGKQVRLKVGQTYYPESGEIRELQVVEKINRLRLKTSDDL